MMKDKHSAKRLRNDRYIPEMTRYIKAHLELGLTIDNLTCSFTPDVNKEDRKFYNEIFNIAKENVRKELENGN